MINELNLNFLTCSTFNLNTSISIVITSISDTINTTHSTKFPEVEVISHEYYVY